jgi:hypothetical protein
MSSALRQQLISPVRIGSLVPSDRVVMAPHHDHLPHGLEPEYRLLVQRFGRVHRLVEGIGSESLDHPDEDVSVRGEYLGRRAVRRHPIVIADPPSVCVIT